MTQVLSVRPSSARTYLAIALFAVVYAGVLVMVIAPRDLFATQSGSELPQGE